MISWLLVILIEQIFLHYYLKIISSYKYILMSSTIYKIAIIFVYRINS